MRHLLKHIKSLQSKHTLWKKGDILVLGVSGGRDSICLLDLLSRLHSTNEISLVVAHINHGLRGDDSTRDQELVEEACHKLAIPLEIYVVPETERGSSEADWRTIRRDFFCEVASKYKAKSIATAHHKNDQAETLLLNLLRGAGSEGLSAMHLSEKLGDFKLIKPLLNVLQQDITAHCEEFKLSYLNDRTNSDNSLLRNRVRNILIPHLEENFNPNIVNTLSRTAEVQAAITKELLSADRFWDYPLNEVALLSFSRAYFVDLTVAQQRTSLRTMITEITKTEMGPSFGFLEELRKTILSTKNKTQKMTGNGLILRCKSDIVELALS